MRQNTPSFAGSIIKPVPQATQLHDSLPVHLQQMVSLDDTKLYASRPQISLSRKKRLLLALAVQRRDRITSTLARKYQTTFLLDYSDPKQTLRVKFSDAINVPELLQDVRRIDCRLKSKMMQVGYFCFGLI